MGFLEDFINEILECLYKSAIDELFYEKVLVTGLSTDQLSDELLVAPHKACQPELPAEDRVNGVEYFKMNFRVCFFFEILLFFTRVKPYIRISLNKFF